MLQQETHWIIFRRCCVFNIINVFPTLLLVLYPIRLFKACLSKCRLDGIVITTFVNKFHGCYRDGLDGGWDTRSLSGLYFFIRISIIFTRLMKNIFTPNVWLSFSLVSSLTHCSLHSASHIRRPTWTYIFDTILLANLSVMCLLLSSEYFKTQAIKVFILLLLMMASVTFFVLQRWCMIKS